MFIFGKKRPDIELEIAATFLKRLIGLLGRRAVRKNYAMFFPNTSSVHTFFMSCDIDIAMVGADMKVLKVFSDVAPFKAVFHKGTVHVLEMAPGSLKALKIRAGEELKIPWQTKN